MKRMKVAIFLLVALVAAPQFANVSNAIETKVHKAGVSENLQPFFADDAESVPVLIQFASRPERRDLDLLQEAGFTGPFVRFEIVPAVSASGSAAAIKSILKNERIIYVEHDAPLKYQLDRATQASRAKDVWEAEYKIGGETKTGLTGKGVGIAVVDSGVDATHPDLIHHTLAAARGLPVKTTGNFKMLGRDQGGLLEFLSPELDTFVEANTLAVDMPDTDTTGGHGTHVAGITSGTGAASAGAYKGSAPGANLIGFGAGEGLHVTMAMASFDWIHQNHEEYNIRVINNSWGGDPAEYNPQSIQTRAVRRLVADGIVVVFAASNDGGDGSSVMTSPQSNIPEAISVANYYDRYGWLDGSSSRGAKTKPHTWPDLAAPGTQIISTAAQGKPVTFVCTGQDALIDEETPFVDLEGEVSDSEPTVIPAPLPTAVETDLVDGEGEVIGNYASCSGTSMAAPHIAGVVALMIEANDQLTPAEVEDILTATANTPEGRTFEKDGFAMGAGLVDAAEAVAVALKMREGLNLKDALRTAYVDYDPSVRLNPEDARNIDIESPREGAQLEGTTVKVSGEYNAGPLTDNSIPLEPRFEIKPITGDANIYQQGLVNPFANSEGRVSATVVAGTNVTLQIRFIDWNEPSTVPPGSYPAEHRVYRSDGSTLVNFSNTKTRLSGTEWSTTGTAWAVPGSTPAGDYVFEGAAFAGGVRYVMGRLPFRIAVAGAPSAPSAASGGDGAPASPAARLPWPLDALESTNSNSVLFQTDFEGGSAGWTVRQDASPGPGLLTNWNFIDQTQAGIHFTWWGTHSGDKMFHAGLSPGANTMSGHYYSDLANTSLISPAITLGEGLSSASLSYWRAGNSETNFDFLKVFVAIGEAAPASNSPAWQEVDRGTGSFLLGGGGPADDWHERVRNLDAYIGETIRLRFQFTSDINSFDANLFSSWYIDDVAVTGVESGQSGPVIVPALSATPAFGVGSLETSLSYSVSANAPITEVVLDFGDGSTPFQTTQTVSSVMHTYGPGFHTATITAFSGTHTATATTQIDVAPHNTIQVRIDGKPWVNPRTALTSDKKWSAVLDLTGLAEGPHTIEARHCDANARCVHDSVEVRKLTTMPEWGNKKPSVKESEPAAVLTAKLKEASTEQVTATFTTIDGTAKAGQDYTAVSQTVTFEAGQTTATVSVPITNDTIHEDVETFTARLTDKHGRTSDVAVSILSDDAVPASGERNQRAPTSFWAGFPWNQIGQRFVGMRA